MNSAKSLVSQHMKFLRFILPVFLILFVFSGCGKKEEDPQILTTTLPVYEFTSRICEGTDLSVGRMITENVSCLHDYTLQVSQMRALENAELVIISGAGLEDFLSDILDESALDASQGVPLQESCDHENHDHHTHSEVDPHIWLAPQNALIMAQNICDGLTQAYPAHTSTFEENLASLSDDILALEAYGKDVLSDLSCRQIITFHDGFAYFAECFNISILRSVEEEAGSEVSAAAMIELIQLVSEHNLPAIFAEKSGSSAAPSVICAETGAKIYMLDMGLSGDSYFEAMYHNINTIKEALE